ncbi:hypothetical protein [Roseateles sp.]|uniref:hypothetical protein n=1 Tax=Roseateles sp. TaxID=1971397 RepID=UPI00286D3F76|nr:hypothetical protein [Roseateles sp.]
MRRIFANRLAFATAVIVILMSALFAAARAQAQALPAQQCRAMPDPQARLLCYDAWVDAQAGLASSKSAAGPAAPAAVSFGLEQQARKAEAQEIESEISGLFEGWGPKQVIKLNNGQLWQITDDSSAVLYLKNPKVKVRRSVLGYFVLEFEASTHTAKVRRLER